MNQANAQQPVQQNIEKTKCGSKGWMVAAIIFGLGFLGTGGYSIYHAINNSGTQQDSTSNGGTKCDVEEASGVDGVDTGDIAKMQGDDYVVKFRRSGITLNLGSKFTVINSAYSQWPVGNASEQIILGGLSENVNSYQNMPSFAVGTMPTTDFGNANESGYWLGMIILSVYQKSWWDSQGIDQQMADMEANGVAPLYNVVYRDDEYIVSYNHPQNVISNDGWEREWEEATYDAFETTLKNQDNWSR